MGMEGPKNHIEQGAQLLTLNSEAYKKVQPFLAMRMFRDEYFKNSSFDTDPAHNSRDKRHEAIDLWGKSLSNLFEEYVRANPTLEVNLSDSSDIEDLYKDFRRWLDEKKETIGDLDVHGVN